MQKDEQTNRSIRKEQSIMSIGDFFRRLRVLIEGKDTEDELYPDEVRPELVREGAASPPPSAAAKLAERMANEYVDPDAPEQEYEPYDDSASVYHAQSYDTDEGVDSFDDNFDYEPSYEPDCDDSESRFDTPDEQSVSTAKVALNDDADAATPPPSRTEVALRQIERLSRQLDDATLREYQMRIIRMKQETGSVSALAALRLLFEYLPEDK